MDEFGQPRPQQQPTLPPEQPQAVPPQQAPQTYPTQPEVPAQPTLQPTAYPAQPTTPTQQPFTPPQSAPQPQAYSAQPVASTMPPTAQTALNPQQAYAQPAPTTKKGLAIAALVLGIISLFVPALGLVAIVLGVVFLAKRTLSGRGLAIAGIILGALGTVITSFIMFSTLIALPSLQLKARDLQRKSVVSGVMSSVESYAANNSGTFPTVETMNDPTFQSKYLSTTAALSNPTSDTPYSFVSGAASPTTISYQPNVNCKGEAGTRTYAIHILLEDKSDYCQQPDI